MRECLHTWPTGDPEADPFLRPGTLGYVLTFQTVERVFGARVAHDLWYAVAGESGALDIGRVMAAAPDTPAMAVTRSSEPVLQAGAELDLRAERLRQAS